MIRLWVALFLVGSSLLPVFAQTGESTNLTSIVEANGLAESAGTLRRELLPIIGVVTILSLAPGIIMMMTCLPLMVIVFGFLRQAIGLQQSPPSMMITSLALFLTFFVMEPVFSEAWATAVKPYQDGTISEGEAFNLAMVPFREFMTSRTHETTLVTLSESLPGRWSQDELTSPPLSLLIPSFMLSEIKTAFQIGFAIFLPFLAIDLVVAAILMAMGMMMVPPAVVSLPFKLAFFVIADGWTKLAGALLRGYAG